MKKLILTLAVVFITVGPIIAQKDILRTNLEIEENPLTEVSVNFSSVTEFEYDDNEAVFNLLKDKRDQFTNIILNYRGKSIIKVTTKSGSLLIENIALFEDDEYRKDRDALAYTGNIGNIEDILILLKKDKIMITVDDTLFLFTDRL